MRVLSSLFLTFALGLHAAVGAPSLPPNVVFILADDLGWGDLSCHGSSFVRTPHIDSLAKEGIDFRQFYTVSPVCSPSRVGFMSGRYPASLAIFTAISGVRRNAALKQADWLDAREVMLPRLFQEAGYATAHFGKWHLQSVHADDAPMPEAYGIQEHALFDSTCHPDATLVDHHGIWEKAVDFIEREKDGAFFLNVWAHETHLAHYPTEEGLQANAHLEDDPQRIYGAVVSDLDNGVGQILAKLEETGLSENTIVIFSSDNGPENVLSTKEYRGGFGGFYNAGESGGKRGRKRSLHDGGVSTPLIVRWPGHAPVGLIDEKSVLNATDLLPTLCAAAGLDLPSDFQGDGESALAAWKGEPFERSKAMYWMWNGTDRPSWNWPRWAMREGDWKLLVNEDNTRVELYQLPADAAEETNVAELHPERVHELLEKLEAWKASLPEEATDCISNRRP